MPLGILKSNTNTRNSLSTGKFSHITYLRRKTCRTSLQNRSRRISTSVCGTQSWINLPDTEFSPPARNPRSYASQAETSLATEGPSIEGNAFSAVVPGPSLQTNPSSSSRHVTFSVNASGQRVVSFVFHEAQITPPVRPSPAQSWPFGPVQGVAQIVDAMEVGRNGQKLGDWTCSTTVRNKKCTCVLLYNYFKYSVMNSDIEAWETKFAASGGKVWQ
jgi:hypothetical protein